MPMKNVPDEHLNLILDAAAEKYKRMQPSVAPEPMVNPGDINRDQGYSNLPDATGSAETILAPYSQENTDVSNQERNPAMVSRDSDVDASLSSNQSGQIPTNTQLSQNAPDNVKVPAPNVPNPISAPLIKVPGAATPKNVISPGEPGTAEQISDLNNNATADVNSSKDLLDINRNALQTKANADVSANGQEKTNYANKLQAQQDFVKEIHQKVADANDQLAGELDQVTNVDPNRIWNNGSVGNKFAFLVSAAAGGLQSGGALSNLITNDINAQVQDVKTHGAKANNLVSLMEKYTGNLMDASKMAYDFQNKYFDLSVQAKKLGAAADPTVIMQEAMKQTLPQYQAAFGNKLAAIKLQQSENKYYSESMQKNAENQLKAAGLNQNKAKIDISQGVLTPEDSKLAQPLASLFNATKDMRDTEQAGLNPASAKYQLFAKAASKQNMAGDAAATLLSGTALNDQQKQDFIKHYEAERTFYTEKALKDSGNRITHDKAELLADGQIAKFYDSPASVRQKQINQDNYLRASIAPLSNQGRNFLKANGYFGNSTATQRPKGY